MEEGAISMSIVDLCCFSTIVSSGLRDSFGSIIEGRIWHDCDV